MRVVHLPFYDDNPYQHLLMRAQSELGIDAIPGGGGGNFLRSALFRWHADVLHFHWLHPYMIRESWAGSLIRSLRFLIELLLIRMAGKRLVWTMHNSSNHASLHPNLECRLLRWITPLFHRVICHSEFARSQAVRELGVSEGRTRVIPHASYIGHYPYHATREEARGRFELPCEARVFLFLGRVAAYKGIEDLITAFRDVATATDVLVIAGRASDSGTFDRLRELAGNDDRIRMHDGFVADDELQNHFAAADVVVFPFRQVLTSGSVILAMGFAKACIAPRLGGIPELGLDDTLLFDPVDDDGLRNSLRAAHGVDLDELGASNSQTASRWDWAGAARETINTYHLPPNVLAPDPAHTGPHA